MPLRREIHAAQEVLEVRGGARGLFQLCVFRLGFLQNGNVGVGVFPEREEILIGGAGLGEGVLLYGRPLWVLPPWRDGHEARPYTGFEGVGTCQSQPGHYLEWLNRSQPKEEVEKIRCAIKRSRPYGSEGWVSKAVAQFGLENTMRNSGRPANRGKGT